MENDNQGYREAFGGNDKSLATFLRAMSEFGRLFCQFMYTGKEFTLRLEVRGNKGEMAHCKVNTESLERTPEAERRIDEKRRKKKSGIPHFPLDPSRGPGV